MYDSDIADNPKQYAMNRGLQYFVFLLTLLFAFSGPETAAQGREGGRGGELPPVLRGLEGTVDDLANAYCESSSSPELYVNPTNLPDPEDYDYVVWELYYYDGGGNEVYRNDLLNPIGSAPNNGVELDIPAISSAGLFNTFLVVEYSFRRGLGTYGGDFDYTIVRKDPEQFDLTIDNSAICVDVSATLTLDGSESDYLYFLYRDGVLQNTVGRNGSGDPISFIQSSLAVGSYSYYVVAHVDDDDVNCETQMNGTPSLTVNPVPTADPQSRPQGGNSGDPFCGGVPFELYDGNPVVSTYDYTWYGPGLDPVNGAVGHTITINDQTVLNDATTHQYTLTITDEANSTGCEASATVDVTIQENPAATPSINPTAVCVGDPIDINANATGGAGSYSYAWSTVDNPTFSSVDQTTITIDPTTLVDNGDVYSVIVTDADGCVSDTADAPALVVNENPSVTITPSNPEVCEEDQVTFTATDLGSGYTYQWYLGATALGTGNTLTLGGGSYALPPIGVDYDISVEAISTSTSCSTTESTLLTVNDKPEVSISDPLEVCNGTASFTLTANFDDGEGVFPGDYNITWYKDGTLLAETSENLTLSSIDETDEATYTVSIEHVSTNCSDSYDHSLTVHTINPSLVASSEEICADDNVTFTASGTDADEYRFLLNGAEVQAFSTVNTWLSNTLSDGDQIIVEIIDVNGCSDVSDPVTMTVNDRPVIDVIGNGGDYCVDDNPVELFSTVTGGDISTSGDYAYSWTAPGGFTSSDEDPSFGPATEDMTQTYTLIATDDNGCASDPATTDLVVNSLPNASAANTGPKCGNGNEDIILQGDPDLMVSYEWFAPGADLSTDVPIGITQDLVLSDVVPANSGIYTLRVVNSNGCENISTTEVIVYELPIVSLGSDRDACIGEDVTLTATITNATTGSYTYTWYVDTGSGWTQLASDVDMDTYTLTDVQLSDDASYSVIVNDGNTCASPRDTLILTVNELPTVTPSATNICAGVNNDILLEGNPDNLDYSYSWSGPGLTSSVAGQDVIVTDDVTTSTPGTYTYTLTILDNSTGCTNSETVDATVFENPTVTIDPVPAICDEGQFTVTANASGGSENFNYSWEFFPEGGGPAVALAYATNTFTVNPADLSDAGTYEVTVTDSGNPTSCTTTASVTVAVNQNPTVSLPDAATCDGQDVTLTATPSGGSTNYVNYIWYDGTDTQIASGPSNTLTLTGTDVALANNGATYSVTVEDDNGCISASDNMTLTVNENPSVTIEYQSNIETNIDVCLGSSMTLDAQGFDGIGTYTYSWTLPDNSTQSGQQLIINPVALTDGGVYEVTVDDGNCTVTEQITVNVIEVTADIAVIAPEADATTICENTSVTFQASGGDSYEFYHVDASGGTTTMVHDASNEWTTSTLEDGDEVYVTAFNTLGCSDDSDPIPLTVIANPTVSITYPSGADNEVCFGQDLTVIADPSGYANYDFYIFNGTDYVKVSPDGYASETFSYPAASFSDDDEFYVVASSGVGCSGESAHETVIVHPLPTATATNSGAECVNETITLLGGDAGFAAYEWFAPEADLSTDSPIGTTMDFDLTNVALSDTGTYTLRVTHANGCQATDATDVLVNELPQVALPVDYSVCEGVSNHDISATITNGVAPYNVVWEFDDGSGATPIPSGADESVYTIGTVAPANEGTYTVTVTDANGCVSVMSSMELTVNEAPEVVFDTDATVNEICAGGTIELVADASLGDGSYTYEWYYDGSLISDETSSVYSFTDASPSDGGTYEVEVIDGNGCASATADIEVSVNALPPATLEADPPFFIEGTTVEFTAGGGDDYTFFVNGVEQSDGVSGNVFVTNNLSDGDSVSVDVLNAFGCYNYAYILMSVFESVADPVVDLTNSEYCEGEGGATVEVINPQNGVTYELVFADDTDAGYQPIVYDGNSAVVWNNVLDTDAPTNYYVRAYWDEVPEQISYSETFEITEYPSPDAFQMTVDEEPVNGETVSNCNSGIGYDIGLAIEWSSFYDYVLLLDGALPLDTVDGASAVPFSFGYYNIIGTYTMKAINEHGCETMMIGSFTIEGDELEKFNLLPEDGRYCYGEEGVNIVLEGSESSLDYILYRNSTPLDTITGSGDALDYGIYSEEGIYNVRVTSPGGCVYIMDQVEVREVELPESGDISIENGGHYCYDGDGVNISLGGQQPGIEYFLIYEDADTVAVHEGLMSGESVNLVNQTNGTEFFKRAGDYYVVSRAFDTGCFSEPSERVTLVVDPLPEIRPILGDTAFCEGMSTRLIVEMSQEDVVYQLIDVESGVQYGVDQVGDGGGALFFEVNDVSRYTIYASYLTTGCNVVFEDTVAITELSLPANDMPVDQRLVADDGSACGEAAIVFIEQPEIGVTYYLWKDGQSSPSSAVYTDQEGLAEIEFPDLIRDTNGDYYVIARSEYGCESRLINEVTIDTDGAMEVFGLVADDDICIGDDDVIIGTNGSENGVEYTLRYASKSDEYDSQMGVDAALEFEPPVNSNGIFYLEGSKDGCVVIMDSVYIQFNPLPQAFELTGSGVYCEGDAGSVIGLNGSEFEVEYYLVGENSGVNDVLWGRYDGSAVNFDAQANNDSYTVYARNSNTTCTSSMKDTVEVRENAVPDKPLFETNPVISCGQDYTSFVISNAQAQVDYELVDVSDVESVIINNSIEQDGALTISPVPAGIYFVRASWAGACMVLSDTLFIEAGETPIAPYQIEYDQSVCFNEGVVITAPIENDEWEYFLADESYSELSGINGVLNDAETRIIWTMNNETAGNHSYYVGVRSAGGGVCGTDYSGAVRVNVSGEITQPVVSGIESDIIYMCPEKATVDIYLSNANTDLFYFLESDYDKEGRNGSNVVFNSKVEGDYYLWASDLQTGCMSDSVNFSVQPYEEPDSIWFDDFITDPIGSEYSVLFGEDSYTFNIDSGYVEDDYFEYYLVNIDSLTSYAVDDYTVEVSEIGNYSIFARKRGTNCDSLNYGYGILNVRSDQLIAKSVYLYLNTGVNEGSDTIEVISGPIDEGKLQFRFIVNEDVLFEYFDMNVDSTFIEYFTGDYTIESFTGLVQFKKALSFNGSNNHIAFEVWKRDLTTRCDTGIINVFAGNVDINNENSIVIPNAFSPNDDGANDLFRIQTDQTSKTTASSFEVYNRWGTLVYRSKGSTYGEDGDWWDGTSNVRSMVSIGTRLPDGVYFYVYSIRVNIGEDIVSKKISGYVELRR